MSTYLSRPLFLWDVDWTESPVQRLDYDLQEVRFGLKEERFWGDQTHVVRGWSAEVPLDSGEAIADFDAWTAELKGRLVGFWMPAPEQAFQLVAPVTPTQFDIVACGLTDSLGEGPEVHVLFARAGFSPVATRITGAEPFGEGLERVTVTAVAGFSPTPEWYVRPLLYVRLAEDTERARFLSHNRQVRLIKVVELPLEYASIETGQTPIHLYRFWIDTDPITEWRFTSFPWDLIHFGQTWVAKRITHGAIQRSTRADAPEFVIECERDPDIPLIHLVPPALAWPLQVEIRESFSIEDTGQVLAIGRVQTVRAHARSLEARCSSFIEALPRSVPGFLLQARCNWQVFSTPCGLDASGYTKTVTVTSTSGRTVVVNDPSLSGLPSGWFAEGWIDVGTGLNRELRTILASTPSWMPRPPCSPPKAWGCRLSWPSPRLSIRCWGH